MHKLIATLAALLTAGMTLAIPAAQAHGFKVGEITVETVWARPTPGGVDVGAVYLQATNAGKQADRIIGAASDKAERVELHTHTMHNGMMMMRPVQGVEVHPGEPALFSPGGNHLMLFGLKEPLVTGDSFVLTLQFEQAGRLDVLVHVRDMTGNMGSDHANHAKHMQDMEKHHGNEHPGGHSSMPQH